MAACIVSEEISANCLMRRGPEKQCPAYYLDSDVDLVDH